jgi:uncharacterized membrane protein (UPF0127 family)
MGLIKKHPYLWLGGALVLLALIYGAGLIIPAELDAGPLPARPTTTLQINGREITAEVVTSSADLYHGLSGRANLCTDCGMLFVFNDDQNRDFVMRNMKFPLDIIFINQHQIQKIAANLPPEGNLPNTIYSSDSPADQVLEVNAGYTQRQGIKIGDTVLAQP